jgi:hypothetical protein
LCFVGEPSPKINFPPNYCDLESCADTDTCEPNTDFGACGLQADNCQPGEICAPTYREEADQNGPFIQGLRCVPDPMTCHR